MQKTVIINRGIPASGKSTFAKEIVSKLPQKGLEAISCSADDYFMVDGGYRFDPSKLREYHLRNQDRFKNALKDDIDIVICDNTNIEPWEAKPYYEMAKEYSYRVVLMDFEPRDISSHHQAQSNDDYRHNIPLATLEEIESRYKNYKELTQKSSYPTSKQPKREYSEETHRVEEYSELSEPFYYDDLIKVSSKDYLKIKETVADMILKKMRDYSLDEIKLIPKEYKIIMEEMNKRADKTITTYDLEHIVGKSPKQIKRYIEELREEFHNIIDIKVGKKNGYKLIDNFDAFIEAFDNDKDIDELFYLAQESNPELFKKLENIAIFTQ